MSQHTAVLLLGSNIGDKRKNISEAITHLEQAVGNIRKMTDIMETEPVEFASSNIFCNIALSICTRLSPLKLLDAVKKIEHQMGRKEDSSVLGAYTDRVIDIDIVKFSNINFECARLSIPHQNNLYHRKFAVLLYEKLEKTRKT